MNRPGCTSPEDTDRGPGLVVRLVEDLNIKYGFERSFKVVHGRVLTNRFLLGFRKHRLGAHPDSRILDVCDRLGMPADFRAAYTHSLPDAQYVHFGFEESERGSLYKAYLEFYEKVEAEIIRRPGGSDSYLIHLGCKWAPGVERRGVFTRYAWYPCLSVKTMLARVSALLDPETHRVAFEITKGTVSAVGDRLARSDIFYVEATEDENPRRSFDINMYRARLRLEELEPLLLEMARHYAVSAEEFRLLYDSIKTRTFGHLSGGIDRQGRDFLTVYYGLEYLPPRHPA